MKMIELRNKIIDKIIDLERFKAFLEERHITASKLKDTFSTEENLPQQEKIQQDMHKYVYLQKEASHLITILKINLKEPMQIGYNPLLFKKIEAFENTAL